MKEELKKFLWGFGMFNAGEIEELAELMTVIHVERNAVLVTQGQVCKQCFFVLKGCMRKYVLVDGDEKTTDFYTENQAVNFFTSYSNQIASDSFLVSVEESTLLVGDPEHDASLFARFPQLEQITRKLLEQDFGKAQDTFARFITSSPKDRYLSILKERPDLLQRVPQHQLASYLGITAESLSRIRKRIVLDLS